MITWYHKREDKQPDVWLAHVAFINQILSDYKTSFSFILIREWRMFNDQISLLLVNQPTWTSSYHLFAFLFYWWNNSPPYLLQWVRVSKYQFLMKICTYLPLLISCLVWSIPFLLDLKTVQLLTSKRKYLGFTRRRAPLPRQCQLNCYEFLCLFG